MVLDRCLILCSKFAKNCLSAELCPDPLGELTTLPRPHSWIMGKAGERRDGKAGGEGREGSEEGGEAIGKGRVKGGVSPE